MKYASTAINNGLEIAVVVLPLETVPMFDPANPPQANTYGVPDNVEVGWVRNQDGSWSPPPPPTFEEQQAQLDRAVRQRLDSFAWTRGYDGILAACSYALSQDPQFRMEGEYCVEARDLTWRSFYAIMADVQNEQRPMPTASELMAELPALAWPGGE